MKIEIPRNIEALIFDCDGTLADSLPIHIEAWQTVYERYGHFMDPAFIYKHTGRKSRDIIKMFNDENDIDLDPDILLKEKGNISYDALSSVQPIKEVTEIALNNRGIMPMSVVSGGSERNVYKTLKTIGIFEYFDFIITADDDIPSKPDPAVFLEAAKRMRTAPDKCHVFEDGDNGIEAAVRAGMSFTDVRKFIGNAG